MRRSIIFEYVIYKDLEDISATLTYKGNIEVIEMGERQESILEYVHYCLRCEALSFEVEDGVYKCSECGFEWEVINFA